MSDSSDKSLIVAGIFGFATICFATGVTLGGDWTRQPYEQSGKPYASAHEYSAAPVTDPFAAYPIEESNSCYHAKSYNSAQLCAEWRSAIATEKAADAAEWTNRLSIIGAVLTLIGVVMVYRGLRHSREANALAQEATIIEHRAWLQFTTWDDFCELYVNETSWTIRYTAKVSNVGKTVAKNVRLVAQLSIRDWSKEEGTTVLYRRSFGDMVPHQRHSYLFPQDGKEFSCIAVLIDKDGIIRRCNKGQVPSRLPLFIIIRAIYQIPFDPPDKVRVTEFIRRLSPKGELSEVPTDIDKTINVFSYRTDEGEPRIT